MDHQFSHGQQDPDQTDDDTGSAESYQCVFCKRGFTNAQALGGHMNIHRRDRARMSSSTTTTSSSNGGCGANKHHQNHTMLNVSSISSNQICGYLRPNSSYSRGDDSKTPRNYCHTYFPPPPPPQPPSMSNTKHFHHQRPQHHQYLQQQQLQQQPLSLFQEDRSYTGLELRIGNPTMYIEDVKRQDQEEEEDEDEEEEIDLELRLGHDN